MVFKRRKRRVDLAHSPYIFYNDTGTPFEFSICRVRPVLAHATCAISFKSIVAFVLCGGRVPTKAMPTRVRSLANHVRLIVTVGLG